MKVTVASSYPALKNMIRCEMYVENTPKNVLLLQKFVRNEKQAELVEKKKSVKKAKK